MNNNQRTGRIGEFEAAAHLDNLGYIVLHRNWRYKRMEIDIIAMDKDMLVFVEVKTRSSRIYGHPESFVDQHKSDCMLNAANAFLEKITHPMEIRFDIIAVEIDHTTRRSRLTHFIDAFYG